MADCVDGCGHHGRVRLRVRAYSDVEEEEGSIEVEREKERKKVKDDPEESHSGLSCAKSVGSGDDDDGLAVVKPRFGPSPVRAVGGRIPGRGISSAFVFDRVSYLMNLSLA